MYVWFKWFFFSWKRQTEESSDVWNIISDIHVVKGTINTWRMLGVFGDIRQVLYWMFRECCRCLFIVFSVEGSNRRENPCVQTILYKCTLKFEHSWGRNLYDSTEIGEIVIVSVLFFYCLHFPSAPFVWFLYSSSYSLFCEHFVFCTAFSTVVKCTFCFLYGISNVQYMIYAVCFRYSFCFEQCICVYILSSVQLFLQFVICTVCFLCSISYVHVYMLCGTAFPMSSLFYEQFDPVQLYLCSVCWRVEREEQARCRGIHR